MHETIQEIKNAIGNEKIEILRVLRIRTNSWKKIFDYVYNPFRRYYITAPDVYGTVGGSKLTDESFQILDQLSVRSISGHDALEIVCDHIVTLDSNIAEIFKCILNKDLKIGVGIKTINKVWPGLIPDSEDNINIPVMLLKNFNEKKIKFPCMAAFKLDGVRGRFINGNMYSRQGKRIKGLGHIKDQLRQYFVDFDGEITVPGNIFDSASGLIRNDKDVPEAIYNIFDVPKHPGNKQERYRDYCHWLNPTDHIKIIEQVMIDGMEELIKFYDSAISAGEEGIVIYNIDHVYRNCRSYDWMRMVPIQSADCRVVGFFEGKRRFEGTLGGIRVNYKGFEVKVGTGFSEKTTSLDSDSQTFKDNAIIDYSLFSGIKGCLSVTRDYIWNHKDDFLGVVAECEFKEETKKGSMRQPRFKKWRFDK